MRSFCVCQSGAAFERKIKLFTCEKQRMMNELNLQSDAESSELTVSFKFYSQSAYKFLYTVLFSILLAAANA